MLVEKKRRNRENWISQEINRISRQARGGRRKGMMCQMMEQTGRKEGDEKDLDREDEKKKKSKRRKDDIKEGGKKKSKKRSQSDLDSEENLTTLTNWQHCEG